MSSSVRAGVLDLLATFLIFISSSVDALVISQVDSLAIAVFRYFKLFVVLSLHDFCLSSSISIDIILRGHINALLLAVCWVKFKFK
jgi:hypothetical protein